VVTKKNTLKISFEGIFEKSILTKFRIYEVVAKLNAFLKGQLQK
jgi:hypothetical protein